MWPNPQFSTDLVTFTEEIFNGKLHFLCSGNFSNPCGVKFILRLNLSFFCVFRYRSYLRLWNTKWTLWFTSMYITSAFSSDMSMIFYVNVTINISIITNSTFTWVFKILIISFSHDTFFDKTFHYSTCFLWSRYW